MLDMITTRRSTRSFKKEMIPADKLDMIIDAGRFAASGCNVQNCHFIVVKKAEVLDKLRDIVQEEYAKMEITDDMTSSMKHSITASKAGTYVFHYNTPVLIIVANRPDNPNNIADTACAIDNMMLEANALDLGSCWINQLRWLQDNDRVAGYIRELGMEAEEKVYGSVAIGYANTNDGLPEREALKRTGNKVTIVE